MPITVKAGVSVPRTLSSQRSLIFVYALLTAARALRATATVTDWSRTQTQNLNVGGVANSQHLEPLATAVDVRNDAAGAELASLWRRLGGQVVDERAAKNHWHLELP